MQWHQIFIGAAYLVLLSACTPSTPAPSPTEKPAPVERPTPAEIPTREAPTPTPSPYELDEQGRVRGMKRITKLPSGEELEEYCAFIYPTESPAINGFFCDGDEEGARSAYQQQLDDYRNRSRR